MESGTFTPSARVTAYKGLVWALAVAVVVLGIGGAFAINVGLGAIAIAYFARQWSQIAIEFGQIQVNEEYAIWTQAEQIRQQYAQAKCSMNEYDNREMIKDGREPLRTFDDSMRQAIYDSRH